MGGLWSSWYTLENPDRVSRMIQMGCPALALETSAPFFMRLIGVPGLKQIMAPLLRPKDIDGAMEFLSTQGSSQEAIGRQPRVMAEAAYHFFHLPTYLDTWKTLIPAVTTITGPRARYQLKAEQLQKIQQPVQFLWGEDDVFGDLQVARQVTNIMPGARLHEMKCGHLPFIDEPEETGRVIREFLSEGRTVKAANPQAVA
jgi:pimeloyl-ACP methyl ester carboxylesterase